MSLCAIGAARRQLVRNLRCNGATMRGVLTPRLSTISCRKYEKDADFHDLSASSWEEKRFYRYYRFSEDVVPTEAQTGVAAGVFMLTFVASMLGVAFIYELITSPKYRHTRRTMRRKWNRSAHEYLALADVTYFGGIFKSVVPDDAPEDFKECYDAPTRGQWKNLTLHEVNRRLREKGKGYEHVNVFPLSQTGYVPQWHGHKKSTYKFRWDQK